MSTGDFNQVLSDGLLNILISRWKVKNPYVKVHQELNYIPRDKIINLFVEISVYLEKAHDKNSCRRDDMTIEPHTLTVAKQRFLVRFSEMISMSKHCLQNRKSTYRKHLSSIHQQSPHDTRLLPTLQIYQITLGTCW